ncbi:MAG: glycerol-3-phosphate dehydrogenase/oxidase [Armatimonadota bacterium]
MRRNTADLCRKPFDLLVIGGGITGALAAWDAAMRGLSVALIERADFGGATSSASGKIIHGGLRYLQHGELRRLRESLFERSVWLKIAPHMLQPVPFLVPTYPGVMRSRTALTAGMIVYSLTGLGIRQPADQSIRIPRFRVLSRCEANDLEPGLTACGATGAVLYHEYVMHSPERLTLSVVMSAVREGATAANYVEAEQFLVNGRRVEGVRARDLLTGEQFDIRASMVINATGPCTDAVLTRLHGLADVPQVAYAKGAHLITKKLTDHAVAVSSRQKYADALFSRGSRHLFIIPWRGLSLVGTSNVPYSGSPDDVAVTAQDVECLISDINEAYPAASLSPDDVLYAYAGLYRVPNRRPTEDAVLIERSPQIIDHAQRDGLSGLVSAVAVKYTTARRVAARAVDIVCRRLGMHAGPSRTHITPLVGGDVEHLHSLTAVAARTAPPDISAHQIRRIAHLYGTECIHLLKLLTSNPSLVRTVSTVGPVTAAEVVRAVREEMAVKLGDVIFRRTGIGTVGHPGDASLTECAELMAQELGWSQRRIEAEISEVRLRLQVPGTSRVSI